jgi:hypothetical protein
MSFLTQKIKSPRSFLKKYALFSFLLNGLVVALSLPYHLGLDSFILGSFVVVIFLAVYFYDLGLMALNNAFLNKRDSSGKVLNRLTYLYLVYTTLAVILIAGQGFLGIEAVGLVLFYGIWALAIVISLLDHRHASAETGGAFEW